MGVPTARRRAEAANTCNIKVAVRVRGGLTPEVGPSTIQVEGNELFVHAGPQQRAEAFAFDHCYGPEATQPEVYADVGGKVLSAAFEGYNGTIFAYGQTGSGKSHSIMGAAHDLGIVPRLAVELFERVNDAPVGATFEVTATYAELYNEVISDLLKPERVNLAIREDKKRGVHVEGLSEWVVRTPDEIYGLMERGAAQRATGSTRMNELSSRSHAVFIVIVENARAGEGGFETGAERGGGPGDARQLVRVGKLNLVDLAGSERVRLTGATGVRLEESKKINQSLSALGNVIKALTESKGRRSHVPYRDSKLTRVLEDSLGGNCKTTMMAMISPALEAFAESLSTVKFANRAKHIKNTARVNEDLDQKSLLRKYERELRRLRQELDERTKNLVDKRALLQLDEQRRKAEADKMRAITELERRSRDFLKEKKEKSELEERINAMQSQMLGNGVAFAEGAAAGAGAAGRDARVVNQNALDLKLKKERARVKDEYESKIRELEADRQEAEEGRAQVGRYKAVLLKQRDIMIALTARLNERDETIIRMQEELKAYDGEYRRVEDALDAKTAELIALRRAAMRHSAESPGARDDELVAALGGWAGEKGGGANPNALRTRSGDATETPRRASSGVVFGATEVSAEDDEHTSLVSELESARVELRAKSAELERLRAEISVASAQSRAARGASPPASPSRRGDAERASADAEKVSAQYREFRREMSAKLEEKNGRVLFLEDECARLKRAAEHAHAPLFGASSEPRESAKESAATAEKVAGFARERAALKTILENKIQSLVAGVNRSVDALGTASDEKAPRLRREVRALERLVAATVQAMDN